MDTSVNLRRVFADVCNGFTEVEWKKSKLYIKHFSHFDQVDIDSAREKYFETAKARGIPTLEQKLKWLEDKKLWMPKDEAELMSYRGYVENLKKTRKTLISSLQKRDNDKAMAEGETKYRELFTRKHGLVGFTCEDSAEQKVQGFYIYTSFYADKKVENKKFSWEEYQELEDEDIDELLKVYLKYSENFSLLNLRKVSLASFFTSYFYMSENFETFFGKPITFLTFFQLHLLSYGMHYKNIKQKHQIPEEILGDPDKIEEFVLKSENLKTTLSKTKHKGTGSERVGIVASREDLKAIGVDTEKSAIFKHADKKGGIQYLTEAVNVPGA